MRSKVRPIARAPEVVAENEAAAGEIFADLGVLLLGEVPLVGTGAVEERPVEDFIAVEGIDGLLDGADVQVGQAADGQDEMAVGAGIVVGPGAVALLIVEAPVPAEDAPVALRIHHTGEDEVGLVLIIGRLGEVVVAFLADVFAKGFLERVQAAHGGKSDDDDSEPLHESRLTSLRFTSRPT